MKAILLVRVSSESQQLDEQTKDLINYSKSDGYKESDLIIIEDKESAIKLSEDERNGLNRMKEYISNNSSINCVYVWELSRLTRKPSTAYNLRDDFFIKNHIQLKCYSPKFQLLQPDLNGIDENGSLLFALYIQMAESEMRNKKARFHRSKIRNAKTGKYSGGFVKYGYYVDDNGYYQIKENEAELIQYVFNRYEQGISILKLNKELLERGLIDSDCFVAETLKCEAYTGLSNKYKMNRVYPQIISQEQYNACQRVKQYNNKNLAKTREVYFGKGLIKCTECGAKYMAMKTSIQYLCYNRFGREQKLNKKLACRTSPSININILDSILFNACIIEESHYLTNNAEKRINELKEQIATNNIKIQACNDIIARAELKNERNNKMFMYGSVSEEKYLKNFKSNEDDKKKNLNLIVNYNNLNDKLLSIINEQKITKKSFWEVYKKNENSVYEINDLIEKQKIIQRHIREVNIIDEIPNQTKIVNIYFHSYPKPLQYRVYHKAKPQRIEMNESFYSGEAVFIYQEDFDNTAPNFWVDVDFKIEKRFVRKKAN